MMRRLYRFGRFLTLFAPPVNYGQLAVIGLICNLLIFIAPGDTDAILPYVLFAYLLQILATGCEIVRPNRFGFWRTMIIGWLHIVFFSSLLYFQLSLSIDPLTFLLMITGGWEILVLGHLLWRPLTMLMMITGTLLAAVFAPILTDPASAVPVETVMSLLRTIFLPLDLGLLPLIGAVWIIARKRRRRRAAKRLRAAIAASQKNA